MKFEMKGYVVVVDIEKKFELKKILYYFKIAPNWMSTLAILKVFSTILDPKMQIGFRKLEYKDFY